MRADQGDIDAPGDQGFESWIGGRFLEAVEVITVTRPPIPNCDLEEMPVGTKKGSGV